MADVINLEDRRAPDDSGEWDGYTCPKCGGAWFTARVAFAANNQGGPASVTAWTAPLACINCDEVEDVGCPACHAELSSDGGCWSCDNGPVPR